MSKAKAKAKAQAIADSSPGKAEALATMQRKIELANGPRFKGIAVCGSHPETILDAPFDDPDWLIYACSPHNLDSELYVEVSVEQGGKQWMSLTELADHGIHVDPRQACEAGKLGLHPARRFLNGGKRPDGGTFRVDQWFEVHVPLSDKTRPYNYLRNLETLERVWTRDPATWNYLPGARPYPQAEIEQRFGKFFWIGSVAFMLAKAVVDCEAHNIPELHIHGILQASDSEYREQRPSTQYWIQRAQEIGIKVRAHSKSQLFEPQKAVF